jgi:hypothetical protein
MAVSRVEQLSASMRADEKGRQTLAAGSVVCQNLAQRGWGGFQIHVVLPEYSDSLRYLTKFSSTVNVRSPAILRVDKDHGKITKRFKHQGVVIKQREFNNSGRTTDATIATSALFNLPGSASSGEDRARVSRNLGAVCHAVICGAEGWSDIEEFGHTRRHWLQGKGLLKQGIPVDDTIARVVPVLSPKELQRSFINWMQDVAGSPSKARLFAAVLECRSAYSKNQ